MNPFEILPRRGTISKGLLLFVASIFAVLLLGFLALNIRPDARLSPESHLVVRVYCASAVVRPVEKVIQTYNDLFDTNVEIVRTGGSGELAGQIKAEFDTGLVGGADLFVSADDGLLAKANSEGIIAERFPLAVQTPVIAVAAGSSLVISGLRDLLQRDDLKFGVASERAAIGMIVRQIAERDGVLAELESKKTIDAENVMTLAQSLVTGSLDAAIVWDTTVAQINQSNRLDDGPLLKIAALADPRNEFRGNIEIGVVSTTPETAQCLKFARFLTDAESGKKEFEAFGFSFID